MLLILLSFFLTSCVPSGPKSLNEVTGKEGLYFELLKNSPPPRMLPGSSSTVAVMVTNLGKASTRSTDEKGIYLWWDLSPESYVKNVDQHFVSGEKESILLGAIETNSLGEKRAFYLGSFSLNSVQEILSEFSVSYLYLNVYSCYPYFTLLEDKVCVDLSLANPSSLPKVCKSETKEYMDGQGAPIGIYKIIPETTVEDTDDGVVIVPKYRILLRNYGKGQPLITSLNEKNENIMSYKGYEYRDPCPNIFGKNIENINKDLLNKAYINAYLSTMKLVCEPSILNFINGEAEALCYLPIQEAKKIMSSGKVSYYAPITIRVDYGYFEKPISREIVINKRA